MIPVIIGITILVFFIMKLAPGDPTRMILGDNATEEALAAKRAELGLDKPLLVQYGNYMIGLLHGDMGISWTNERSVSDEVFSRFPATLKLAAVSALVSIVLAIPLGILAAIKRNTFFDHASMALSLIGISMPAFWLALMLMLLFSVRLGWFPVQGAADGWRSYVLPSIAIGFMNMAAIARTTRSSMLDTISQDYIRTARAKGISENEVIMHHAFRNALRLEQIHKTCQTVRQIAAVFVEQLLRERVPGVKIMVGGAVLTETVFACPGLGRYIVQSVNGRDIPAVMGCIIVMAVAFSLVNLLVDLLYGFIDPRIKSMYK